MQFVCVNNKNSFCHDSSGNFYGVRRYELQNYIDRVSHTTGGYFICKKCCIQTYCKDCCDETTYTQEMSFELVSNNKKTLLVILNELFVCVEDFDLRTSLAIFNKASLNKPKSVIYVNMNLLPKYVYIKCPSCKSKYFVKYRHVEPEEIYKIENEIGHEEIFKYNRYLLKSKERLHTAEGRISRRCSIL